MGIAEHMPAELRAKTSAVLGEPVLDMCAVNRVGVLSNIATRALANVAGELLIGQTVGPGTVPKDEIRRVEEPPTPLPHAFLLAFTAQNIHVFSFKAFMGRMKLKDELGAFQRAGLEVAVQENEILTVYHVNSPQQRQDMMFEMMGGSTAGGEYTRELADLLRGAGAPPAA